MRRFELILITFAVLLSAALVPAAAEEGTELYGKHFTGTETLIDLNDTKIDDLTALYGYLREHPGVRSVEACNCGRSNEELAALREAFPDIKVVWTVKIGKRFTVRTDVTHFATWNILRTRDGGIIEAKNVTGHKTKDVETLRYCTDLVALDLGHNSIEDLSFLAPLKKLRWLILADNKFTDISVLAELPDLYYVELLSNRVHDVTPLANHPELVDLNICGLSERDALAVTEGNPKLERLWITDFFFSDKADQRAAIEAALPDTEICWVKDDEYTGYGWRTHRRYYEMRAELGWNVAYKYGVELCTE